MQALSLEATQKSQQMASSPRHNVWVNANAGTGKTKVLTDRVLRLLLSGVSADAILCITFTNNAAAEMRHRLLDRSQKWLDASDEDLRKELADITGEAVSDETLNAARGIYLQLSDAPHLLHFTTIHGFAQELLQRFPLEAGLSPYFTVLEEGQSKALLWEAAQQLLSRATRPSNQGVNDALQTLSGTINDDDLIRLMKQMVDKRGEVVRFFHEKEHAKLHAAIDAFCEIEPNAPEPEKALMEYSAAHLALLGGLVPVLEQGKKTEEKAIPIVRAWYANVLEARFDMECYKDYYATLITQKDTDKNVLGGKLPERYPEYMDFFDHERQRLRRYEAARKARDLARLSHAFIVLSEAVNELYEQRKRARNALDFDDLIERTGALLKNAELSPWVLYKMDRRISHVMLDEAQDTSPDQWELIVQLCEEYVSQSAQKTVFVVGDTKQSIYGFQGAKPAQLAQHKTTLSRFAEAQGSALSTVAMQRSFRSTNAVLQVVDACFVDAARRYKLQYNDDTVLHGVHREEVWGRVECWPVIAKPEAEPPEAFSLPLAYESQDSGQSLLAQEVATQIQTWLEEQTLLPSKSRAITPGDILVLVRSRKPFVQELTSLLKRAGVPVAGADRLVLQSHLLVKDLVALGQWACVPQDDYSLACVLKSPLCGVSEDALFSIAHGREGSLWQAVQEKADADVVALLEAVLAQVQTHHTPSQFFAELALRTRLEKRYYPLYGAEAREILQLFLDAILQLEHIGVSSLTECLHRFSAEEQKVKQEMEAQRNEVRIMTVHGAKGLQAPIVLVPEILTSTPNRNTIFMEGEAMLYAPNAQYHTERFAALKAKAEQAEEEESARLLYVAMTRAEDWLLHMCYCQRKDLPEDSWTAWVQDALRAQGATEDEQGRLVLQTGEAQKQDAKEVKRFASSPLDKALYQAVPEWESPLRNPSHSEEHAEPVSVTDGMRSSAERGNRIHKLLEVLTPLAPAQRQLSLAQAVLEDAHCADEFEEVMGVFAQPELAALFAQPLQFEVPVLGTLGAHVYRGAIDCLIKTDDGYVIMDFKTGAVPTDGQMPDVYRAQLQGYQELMRNAYPAERFAACLLWTQTGELQWL